jgi:hypothetical protein
VTRRVRLLDGSARVGDEIERPAIVAGIPMVGYVRVRFEVVTMDVLCIEEDVEVITPAHVAYCACGRELHFYDLRNDPKTAPENARCAECQKRKAAE